VRQRGEVALQRIAIETNELAAMVAFASARLGSAILTPTVVREADLPVSLVRLADVGPLTTAQKASARSTPVQRDPAAAKARTQPHRTGLGRW
jgi:hypothetical protein